MATKHYNELKQLNKDELVTRVRDLETGIFQARMKKATGQLENGSSLWRMRKDLARLKMLQSRTQGK